MKTIKLNGEYTKEELEEKLEELKKPKIEFRAFKKTTYNYKIELYIDGLYKWNMSFDKNDAYSYKLYQFNNLIEKAIALYGGKKNFQKQKDINDDDIKLYGFGLDDVINTNGIAWSYYLYNKHLYNCYSKSKEVAKEIYEAYKPVIEYTKKAFWGE